MMKNTNQNLPKNPQPANDPWAQTRPTQVGPVPEPASPDPTSNAPTIYTSLEEARRNPSIRPTPRRTSKLNNCGCISLLPIAVLLLVILAAYFLAPLRTNVLLLGLDARPDEGMVGRTDTMILTTIIPLKPYIGMLSIPRDLWVNVPGHGENRINTAHFFAEAENPGSGPAAAMQVVTENFGVDVGYYVRIRFTSFEDVINAMGGVDVNLPEAMSGYEAGLHHMDGAQALALVRDRSGSDDFFRMGRGQIFLKSLFQQMLQLTFWPRLPQTLAAMSKAVDTNLPVWQWPRLGLALLRLGPGGIDARTISREMVNPFTTSGGAAVLGPNWEKINPVLLEMFGQ